jgi:UDP-N-acetylglucosamine 2-epimerase
MAPVAKSLSTSLALRPVLVSTGQHTELLSQAFAAFDLVPDVELSVMTAGQSPSKTAARILDRMSPVLEQNDPVAVLVQGDTTTALAAGLAAYYHQIPLGHVEAGLRTFDLEHPFPEEGHRQLIDRVCRWCFAPTPAAKANLLRENIPTERISVTGNTGIDAMLDLLDRLPQDPPSEPFVLVTLHRRESFGNPLEAIVGGLIDFLDATPGAKAVWPTHPNPGVASAIARSSGSNRLSLRPPQDYPAFVKLLSSCRLVLTDSGGVQEEAPSLGKRVLVARETTERPEAVETGQNRLIGRDRSRVAAELSRAWAEPPYSGPVPVTNPYGDGRAAERIVSILHAELPRSVFDGSTHGVRVGP